LFKEIARDLIAVPPKAFDAVAGVWTDLAPIRGTASPMIAFAYISSSGEYSIDNPGNDKDILD
jgi:hypothetical protein